MAKINSYLLQRGLAFGNQCLQSFLISTLIINKPEKVISSSKDAAHCIFYENNRVKKTRPK